MRIVFVYQQQLLIVAFVCLRSLVHRKVLFPWTDERLGNCRYLDTCNNTLKCK